MKDILADYFERKRKRFFKLVRKLYPDYKDEYAICEELINLAVSSSSIVFDLGCGRNITFEAAKRTSRLVVGVDVSWQIRDNLSLDTAVIGDAIALPFRNASFDIVLCMSVMEHLEDPPAVASEISRVLRGDGSLFVVTPNLWGYRSLIAVLIPNRFHASITKFIDHRAEADTFPTYFRANTVGRLSRMMSTVGLVKERAIMFEGYPPFPFSLTLTRAMAAYGRLIDRFDKLAFLRSVIIAQYCKPKVSEEVSERYSFSS